MKCGNCKGDHEKVSEVRDCYAQSDWDEQQAKAEAEAERRNERFFEEGPESFQAMRWAEEQEELLRVGPSALKGYAELDDEALAGQVLDQMTGAPGRDMASPKQVSYALDLLKVHEWPDNILEHDLQNMERRQVSKLIDQLKLAPKKQQLELEDSPPVGMYIADDGQVRRVIRVYLGQQSGRNLVKMIVAKDGGPGGAYGYDYIGSAANVAAGRSKLGKVKLSKMELEEAKEWGRLTGSCVVCGRRLDVPESVEAGIGPKCATKEYW